MKTRIIALLTLAQMAIASSGLMAQPKGPNAQPANPAERKELKGKNPEAGFTDEQKTKMKEIRLAAYKEIKPLQNQLGELQAKERTLTTADKADMNAINANIEDIAKVKVKIAKIEAANLQQIRSLLTDEQKIKFDSRPTMMRGNNKMAMGRGMARQKGERPAFQKGAPRNNVF